MADVNNLCEDPAREVSESKFKEENINSTPTESHDTMQIIECLNSKNRALEDLLQIQSVDRVKLKEEIEILQNSLSSSRSELRLKTETLTKCYEDEKHDKECMVLKFAQAEQKNLDTQKKIREIEGRLRESKYNVDQANQEKERLIKELKSKNCDFTTYERELNNLKASLTVSEQKHKIEKSRFDDEIDKSKEIKKRYDDLQRSMLVLKEENATLRLNCQEIVKKYQTSEDMLSNSLSTSLRQVKEDLRKCMEEKKEAVDSQSKISSELHISKSTINSLNQELKNLREKLKHVEADKMCQEETVRQLKDALKSLTFVKDQLTERVSSLEPFESRVEQVNQENDRLIFANTELRKINEDNETLLTTLRRKESDLLEFIQSLSNKNAELQTEKHEFIKETEKLQQQISKVEQLHKDAVVKINFWENKFKIESKNWSEERENILKRFETMTNEVASLNQKLLDSNDEILSLKKKHKAHIKDLTRQLTKSNAVDISRLNEQKEVFPLTQKPLDLVYISESNSEESQYSNQNVNEKEETDQRDDQNNVRVLIDSHISPKVNGKDKCYLPTQPPIDPNHSNNQGLEIHLIEPYNQVLVDKIIRLQQINAKMQEKIEFLTEHTVQLTQDIQQKSLLLRYLFSQNEDKGSVKSDFIDDNHLMMSKKGGIMASVFSSRQADEHMTLELSLEINRRLQSVLEDTTIKNFTLKDSINTLGEEISKLSFENCKLKGMLKSS